MKNANPIIALGISAIVAGSAAAKPFESNQVATASGIVEGVLDGSGVRFFLGVPFAQPPVGDLRWRPPQPPKSWDGVRKADHFGPRGMQRALFSDMKFRSDGVSEDSLYLNVWTPAKAAKDKLPVLVYFYGGGFTTGDGSEYRYDGMSMARRGIVAVTANYRLGAFGFLALPELTQESPHHASGNYGLLDQQAALAWVQKNIAAFGGDPKKVTIAGESAGSISVSAQMASPLSKGLFARAIGESGSLLGAFSAVPLAQAEVVGAKFMETAGAKSLAELRALPAEKILAVNAARIGLAIDGYFLPEDPMAIFTQGRQALVPLLVGWNSQESEGRSLLRGQPNVANFESAIQRLYPTNFEKALSVYKPEADNLTDVTRVANELAGDRWISFSTWRWAYHQSRAGQPVYRYYYVHPRPAMLRTGPAGLSGSRSNAPAAMPAQPPPIGAVHSAEIEYALGNLSTNALYGWAPEDFKLSEAMQSYFANFIKTGNPNGKGLPVWPKMNDGKTVKLMRLDVKPEAQTALHDDRYFFLEEAGN